LTQKTGLGVSVYWEICIKSTKIAGDELSSTSFRHVRCALSPQTGAAEDIGAAIRDGAV
jgi:hypothetical protein